MGNVWLRRYSLFVVVCTLAQVVAGALVTSNDVALAIPDWPLAYGKLIPPLEGGIRLEFAHRVLAASVSILTFILAWWLQRAEPRVWLRRLGWAAVAAIVGQVLLGGAAVLLVAPHSLVIAHACLAQLFFGTVVAIAVAQAPSETRAGVAGAGGSACQAAVRPPSAARQAEPPIPSTPADRGAAVCATAAIALLVQTALGAAVRHNAGSLLPHIAGAGLATALVMWAGLRVLMHQLENTLLRRSASMLLSLTFSQVLLGMGSYMTRLLTLDDPQPAGVMIAFTVAHVAAGSLAFGAAVALALVVYRDAQPPNGVLAHGGMAVA